MTYHERSLLIIELQSIYSFLDGLRNQGSLKSARDIAQRFVENVDQWVLQIAVSGNDRYPASYQRARDFSDRRVLVPRRWSERSYVKGLEPPFKRPLLLENGRVNREELPFNALSELEARGFSIHTSDVEGTRHLAADLLLDVATVGRPEVLLIATADDEVASLLRSLRAAGTRTGLVLFSSFGRASKVARIPDRLLSMGELVATLNAVPLEPTESAPVKLDLDGGFEVEKLLIEDAEQIISMVLNGRVRPDDRKVAEIESAASLPAFYSEAVFPVEGLSSAVNTLPEPGLPNLAGIDPADPARWEAMGEVVKNELPGRLAGWLRYLGDQVFADPSAGGGDAVEDGSATDGPPAGDGLTLLEWHEWYLVSATLIHKAAFTWFYRWIGEEVLQRGGQMVRKDLLPLLQAEVDVLRSVRQLDAIGPFFGFSDLDEFLRAVHFVGGSRLRRSSPEDAPRATYMWAIDGEYVKSDAGQVAVDTGEPTAPAGPGRGHGDTDAPRVPSVDFERLAAFVDARLQLRRTAIALSELATMVSQHEELNMNAGNAWGGSRTFLEMLQIAAARTGRNWELITDVGPGYIRMRPTGRDLRPRLAGDAHSSSPGRGALMMVRRALPGFPADSPEQLTLKAAAHLTVLGPQSPYSILRTSISGITLQARDLGNLVGLRGGGRDVYTWVLRGVRGVAGTSLGEASNAAESIYGQVVRFLVEGGRDPREGGRSPASKPPELLLPSPGGWAAALVQTGALAVVELLEARGEPGNVIKAARERLGLDRAQSELVEKRLLPRMPKVEELSKRFVDALVQRSGPSGIDGRSEPSEVVQDQEAQRIGPRGTDGRSVLSGLAEELRNERRLFLDEPADFVRPDGKAAWSGKRAEALLRHLHDRGTQAEEPISIKKVAEEIKYSYSNVITALAWTERRTPNFLDKFGLFVEDDLVFPVRLLPRDWTYRDEELARHRCIQAARDVAKGYLKEKLPISWIDVVLAALAVPSAGSQGQGV